MAFKMTIQEKKMKFKDVIEAATYVKAMSANSQSATESKSSKMSTETVACMV